MGGDDELTASSTALEDGLNDASQELEKAVGWDLPKVGFNVRHWWTSPRVFGLDAPPKKLRLAVRMVHSDGVSSPDRNSWDEVSVMLRKRGVESLETDQEGNMSSQVDSEESISTPSCSGGHWSLRWVLALWSGLDACDGVVLWSLRWYQHSGTKIFLCTVVVLTLVSVGRRRRCPRGERNDAPILTWAEKEK